MGKTVVISREWHKPEIDITVTDEDIQIKMPLADFMEALAKESGNPFMLVTNGGLRRRLLQAADVVCGKMKQESTQVMGK